MGDGSVWVTPTHQSDKKKAKLAEAVVRFGVTALGIPPGKIGKPGDDIQTLCKRPPGSAFHTTASPRGSKPFRPTTPMGVFHGTTCGPTERRIFCNLRTPDMEQLNNPVNTILDHLWLLAKALVSCMHDTDARAQAVVLTRFADLDEHFTNGIRSLVHHVIHLLRITRWVLAKHRATLPDGMFPFVKHAKATWDDVRKLDPALPEVPTKEFLNGDKAGVWDVSPVAMAALTHSPAKGGGGTGRAAK